MNNFRDKFAHIKKLNATNDAVWYETIHQYYPELVEELLVEMDILVNREQKLLAEVERWKKEVVYFNQMIGEVYETN